MGQTAAELRVPQGVDVLDAARERVAWCLDRADRACVSFSGGKDSTVMLHIVMDEAIRRGVEVGVLFVDLEGQYSLTVEHVTRCLDMYAGHIDPYWVALPLTLRNAVSQYEPQWMCWEPGREDDWVREPPDRAITAAEHWPWFRVGMEFEEFVPAFARWYGGGDSLVSFVGIRSQESLNRWRSLASDTKQRFANKSWTTVKDDDGPLWNAYPVYDWETEDIWTYHARFPDKPYNELYDRMHRAGLSIHQARICQPYGDDQRRGLWLWHIIEPETWGKVVARVNGANSGARYAQETGNITGVREVTLPEGHTWESFSRMLLDTMPPKAAEHYRNKIAKFLKWWYFRGYEDGIPDEGDPRMEAARRVPSWRRIAKVLLRNDYWCKGLSFSPQNKNSSSYARYTRIMKENRRQWDLLVPTAGVLDKPTIKQLALIAALTGGNNPNHAWRAMGAALGESRGWCKRNATSEDASAAIEIIKQADADLRKEKFGHAT